MKDRTYRNFVAKHAWRVNRAAVHKNKKADQKAGRKPKHKEKYSQGARVSFLEMGFPSNLLPFGEVA